MFSVVTRLPSANGFNFAEIPDVAKAQNKTGKISFIR